MKVYNIIIVGTENDISVITYGSLKRAIAYMEESYKKALENYNGCDLKIIKEKLCYSISDYKDYKNEYFLESMEIQTKILR